jgi:2-iminobutanoate/2-iminopropanoate deaminase
MTKSKIILAALTLLSAAWPDLAAAEAAAPAPPVKPFSDAAVVGGVIYTSGQIGVRPGESRLVPGGMTAEAHQAMDNIGVILKANGASFADVFKCSVALSDMSKWGEFNSVYLTYFKAGRLPVRNAFGASALAYGGQIEIDCLARMPTAGHRPKTGR